MRKIFICCLISLVAFSNAQPVYFNNRYGFAGYYEAGGNIVEASDGYIILEEAVDSQWYYHLGIIKIDKMGNEVWKKIYGNTGNNYGAGVGGSLIKTYDGNFANGGLFRDTSGKYYSHLVKFNNNGDTLWTRRYGGGNQGNSSYNCKQTPDSGFVLIGVTDVNDPDLDILLIKTDPSGNLQWEKTYGGGGVEYGFWVIVTNDGGYLLSGHTDSFGAGANDAYVIKTDNMGNIQWDTTYGTVNSDCGYNFIETSDGGYIGCGCEFDTILSGSYYQSTPSIMRIDSIGKILWRKEYGPSRYISGISSIYELSDGSFVAKGQLNNNKGTPNGNGWAIGVILKVTSNGDSIWYRTHEYDTCEKNFDYFRDMKPTSDGGFIVAGFFTPRTFDPCNDTGTQDMWVIKLDSCGCAYLGCDSACQGLTAIQELPATRLTFDVEIQPNPNNGKFYVEIYNGAEAEKSTEIRIYDILGAEIKQMKAKSNKIDVDISACGAGIYFIQVKNEKDYYHSRFVKY